MKKINKINITELSKNLLNTLENVIKYNEIINVSTKNGNAIILSEEEYNGIIATIELCSDAKLKKKIIDGENTPIDECLDIDEVKW